MKLPRKMSEGRERDVYFHPDDPALIVKVMKPAARSDRNALEWDYFRKAPPCVTEHIAGIRGMAETEHGPGLVCELIRDHDGRPSRSLKKSVIDGELPVDAAKDMLDGVFAWASRNLVAMCDSNPHNFLLERRPAGCRLVMIDGFGPGGRGPKWWLRMHVPRLLIAKNDKAYQKILASLSRPMGRPTDARGPASTKG